MLIALVTALTVEGRGKRRAPGTVGGRIAALNPGSITIARRSKNTRRPPRAYTFALAQQTAVVLPNGRPAEPNALQMGVRVRVAFQVARNGTPVATQIQIVGR
jgi:hypothetical protein